MSPSNCLLYLAFAEAYSETDLGNLAMKTALWYFQQAAGTSYLIDLPVDLLAKLLDHAYLNVKSELEVFSVIQSWTQGDPETRVEDCCNRLLDTVRWNLLTTQETNVVLESKLTKFGSFKRAVETKIELTVQSSTEAESTQGCKVRKTPLFPCVVGRMRAVKAATMTGLDVPAELIAPLRPCCNKFHQVRPCCKNKAMVSFLFVVKDSNEVEPLMALSKVHGAQGFRVISHGPTVLFTGGEYSLGKSDWNRDVWTYDTIASKWKACAPLETCRRHHSVCVSEERGEAYLVGGYSTHRKRLMRMEKVDLRPASRDEVPDLDLPREFKKPSACFFKGKLYVIEEAPIVAYDMGKKSWENVDCSDFPKNIVFNSAVPYKDCIYLTSITGYSLYKFDPESQSIHFVGKFRDETQNICIVGDTIYSFSSDHFDYRSSIETYDIAKAEFKQIWERHTDEIEFAPYEPSGCFPVVLFPEM